MAKVAYETLTWTVDPNTRVGVLTLSRPEALNAFTNLMLDELAAWMKAVARDRTVGAVVVTGAGRGFSAGQDLKEHVANNGAAGIGHHLRTRYNPLMEQLYTLPKPTLAAVNGVAAGAGMSLALACDLRVAGPRSRFVQAFIGVGLVPDSGSTLLLPSLIGPARALEMALTGAPMSGEDALRCGLVNRLVPDDEVLPAATAWAAELAAQAPKAVELIKRAMKRASAAALGDAMQYEAWLQSTAAATRDHQEGLRAFLDKRPPRFTGE
jgi:2-(1,2-epoxy-1,2-dihydrophenyl)acetyl-CoA isomerase